MKRPGRTTLAGMDLVLVAAGASTSAAAARRTSTGAPVKRSESDAPIRVWMGDNPRPEIPEPPFKRASGDKQAGRIT